jgi:hypothetical protein
MAVAIGFSFSLCDPLDYLNIFMIKQLASPGACYPKEGREKALFKPFET